MQSEYEDTNIRFTKDKIELLRNRFVYAQLHYVDIHQIKFSDGFLVRNRWLIRILAIAALLWLIVFIRYGASATANFQETNLSFWFNRGAMIGVWGPLILMVFLLLAIYQTFIRATVIHITSAEYDKKISIKQLYKKGEVNALIGFLKSKEIDLIDLR